MKNGRSLASSGDNQKRFEIVDRKSEKTVQEGSRAFCSPQGSRHLKKSAFSSSLRASDMKYKPWFTVDIWKELSWQVNYPFSVGFTQLQESRHVLQRIFSHFSGFLDGFWIRQMLLLSESQLNLLVKYFSFD
mmetsp:Transcript_7106/g.12137  ORF Transcript_7106/g.12137 Transcript_7106/m.12137 type:complete len:132 (-) Transcript_7106:79-474(-)